MQRDEDNWRLGVIEPNEINKLSRPWVYIWHICDDRGSYLTWDLRYCGKCRSACPDSILDTLDITRKLMMQA